ncbi:hypothetical protein CR513_07598, partial [Mucuna pruriens]
MKKILYVKTNLDFIDWRIKKPRFNTIKKLDSMVMAQIINSTNLSLHSSISRVATREVWLELEEHFSHTNAPRIYQLWHTLCLMQHDP